MPTRHEIDENSLLKAAQDGDPEAYGQIYEYYAPRIFRFLAAHLDDPDEAEDLTEEIFLRVYQTIATYRPANTPFSSYLFKAARNILTDHYRKSSRRISPLPLVEDQIQDSRDDPARRLGDQQERIRIQQLMAQLQPDYRMVLSLRFFELSQVMGRSPGAVRVLQHRALQAMRKLMSDQEINPDGYKT